MANRHYAKIGDVWKHLVLSEALALERPRAFWESHAGSARYSLARSSTREYGALYFLEHAHRSPALAKSAYFLVLKAFNEVEAEVYPGSPLLAMSILRRHDATFLFCDRDTESLATIRECAHESELDPRAVRTVASDGIRALADAAASVDEHAASSTLAHIDPYDPLESGDGGMTSVDLFCRLIAQDVRTLLWYGYDSNEGRRRMHEAMHRVLKGHGIDPAGCNLWQGEITLAAIDDPTLRFHPGVFGCGILAGNLNAETASACNRLGEGLEAVYRSAVLPGNHSGALCFSSDAGPDPSL